MSARKNQILFLSYLLIHSAIAMSPVGSFMQLDKAPEDTPRSNTPPTLTFRAQISTPKAPSFLEEEAEEAVQPEYIQLEDSKVRMDETLESLDQPQTQFLQKENDVKSRDLNLPLRDYETLQLLVHTLNSLAFGQYFPEVIDFQKQCEEVIDPHIDADRERMVQLKSQFDRYCETDHTSTTLFDILSEALKVHIDDVTECHDRWGSEKLSQYFEYSNQFIYWVDEMKRRIEITQREDHALAKTQSSPNPTDPEMRQRYDKYMPAQAMMMDNLRTFSKSISDFIKTQDDNAKAARNKKHQVGVESVYKSMQEQAKENMTQMLQILANHADFFCSNDAEMNSYFSKTLPIWSDMIDSWKVVTDDDTFPPK